MFCVIVILELSFSTLDSGLRDETAAADYRGKQYKPFSTLDSGLRDETVSFGAPVYPDEVFQYPRLGSTR